MKTIVRQSGLRRTLIAAAVLAAFTPAYADDDESVVEASVSAGAAAVSGDPSDRAIWGQYNGYRQQSGYGLLDFDYYRRNDETGTMTRFRGTDLGIQTRELDFLWKRQGDWKFRADYSELVHYNPYQVNTGLQGTGGTSPQVMLLPGGPGTGSTTDLGTKRKGLGLAFSKWFGPAVQLDLGIKSEKKDGTSLFGRGITCPSPVTPGCSPTTGIAAGWAALYLPEPVDSTHTQLEARLNYAVDKLRLTGGYYGSFYNNSSSTLNPIIPGFLNGPLGNPLPLSAGLQPILNQTMALWPDNESHQFDVAGNYLFTPTTRGNFKLAYLRASQTQNFDSAGLYDRPGSVTNLGAKVNTKRAQLGITSRPMPKLSLVADLRYEDRDDETPIQTYNYVGTGTYTNPNANDIFYTNRNYSWTRLRGKVEAAYQFTRDYRGLLGVGYDSFDRGTFTPTAWVTGVSALRAKTEEISYRAELRRRMSENFSGSIAYITSKRDGTDWLKPNAGPGVTAVSDTAAFLPTAIFMPSLADRQRDKLRLMGNWQATEDLSLQLSIDGGQDKFDLPTDYALRKSKVSQYTLDADYAITSRWRLNGYLSYGGQKLNQARPAGSVVSFDNTNTTLGLNLTGKPTSDLEVGAGFAYMQDRNSYDQGLDTYASANSAGLLAAAGGLPDIVYRTTEFRVFGGYKLSKQSSVRVDFVHFRAKWDDWGYAYGDTPYVFSDNTTVTSQQSQNVTFVGARYLYRWQ